MTRLFWRGLIVTHRYLGVAVGVLMLSWFVSGIVMMYVAYPELSGRARVQALPPIAWTACCAFDAVPVAAGQRLLGAELEMAGGAPVLILRPDGEPPMIQSLKDAGGPLDVTVETARASALAAAARLVAPGAGIVSTDIVDRDQWTVGEDYGRHRPLHRFGFDDPAGTVLYVSGTTGQVVLWTTYRQRFWNWLGAVPHWLYFTELRAQGRLWSQIVIWTSILGGFLTIIGLYLGIAQFGRRPNGRLSPYRGWFYWHHMIGLVFGVVTLLWVVSGTLSMNPWGLLEGHRGGERARLQGAPQDWGTIRASLAAIIPAEGIVHLVSAPLNGTLFWLATDVKGMVTRLDARGRRAVLTDADLAQAASRLTDGAGIETQGLLRQEDAYYFAAPASGGAANLILPVYRVILNSRGRTRYYLDPATGGLLRVADGDARAGRWLFDGLHRWDFAAWLRARPLWDGVMLLLLAGGTAGTLTGVYLALKRIKRDLGFK